MALPQAVLQEITQAIEQVYGVGVLDGQVGAEAAYFGKSARVLTGGIFASALGAAAQMLRQHDVEASQFFKAKSDELAAWITPPRIESTEPVDGATGIVANNGISVKFVAPGLNPASVTADNVYVTPAAGGSHLAGNLVYHEDTLTLTFTPANDLSPGTVYKVTLGKGLQATGGMTLGDDHTISFTSAVA
jgi:hypothetical protein